MGGKKGEGSCGGPKRKGELQSRQFMAREGVDNAVERSGDRKKKKRKKGRKEEKRRDLANEGKKKNLPQGKKNINLRSGGKKKSGERTHAPGRKQSREGEKTDESRSLTGGEGEEKSPVFSYGESKEGKKGSPVVVKGDATEITSNKKGGGDFEPQPARKKKKREGGFIPCLSKGAGRALLRKGTGGQWCFSSAWIEELTGERSKGGKQAPRMGIEWEACPPRKNKRPSF